MYGRVSGGCITNKYTHVGHQCSTNAHTSFSPRPHPSHHTTPHPPHHPPHPHPHSGTLESPPTFTPTNEGGKQLLIDFEYSDVLWPWSGYLALFIRVHEGASGYDGIATGVVRFIVMSPPPLGEQEGRTSVVEATLRVRIIPTPARYGCVRLCVFVFVCLCVFVFVCLCVFVCVDRG